MIGLSESPCYAVLTLLFASVHRGEGGWLFKKSQRERETSRRRRIIVLVTKVDFYAPLCTCILFLANQESDISKCPIPLAVRSDLLLLPWIGLAF